MSQLAAELSRAILPALPDYFPRQRWFGDKARTIASVAIASAAELPFPGARLLQVIAEVSFTTGPSALYFLPLLAESGSTGEAIAIVDSTAWRDAVRDVRFQGWIIDQLASANGGSAWKATDRAAERLTSMRDCASRVGTAEQSNSSVLYPDVAIAKVLRKLQPGVHPEIELSRFLTQKGRFRNTPELLGSWESMLPTAEPVALAVVQAWVENTGDCWSHLLDLLGTAIADDNWQPALDLAGLLGQRTAEMHLALSSDPWTPAVAPEPVTRADVARWSESLAHRLADLGPALHGTVTPDERTNVLVNSLVTVLPGLERRTHGFERLIGTAKTRVHGDYHLGQVLATPDGDVMILDFEGEPMRTLAERRAKTSPLKDLAGMIRSFSYARGSMERQRPAGSVTLSTAALVDWERKARTLFIERYIAAARAAKATFLPPTDEDVRVALAAWEIDKAIYEVHYELNNRPDWLGIPVAGLLKLA